MSARHDWHRARRNYPPPPADRSWLCAVAIVASAVLWAVLLRAMWSVWA